MLTDEQIERFRRASREREREDLAKARERNVMRSALEAMVEAARKGRTDSEEQS
jgi:hypothetical protein